MTLNPNQALIQAVQSRMQGRAQGRQTAQQRNATADWLASKGAQDLAEGVRTGAIPAAAALQMMQQRAAGPEPGYRQALGSDLGLAGESADKLFNVGPDGKITAIGGAGTTINMPSAPQIGTIPPGYQVRQDEAGAYRMEPIPGGPVEQEMAEQAEREQKGARQQGQQESIISGSVDYLINKIDDGGVFNLPETGVVGNLLGQAGVNQEAVDFRNELATIQANIAFDRLQKMREASKTGGALGAVSERELTLLMNAYGNLEQSTSPDRLRQNLLTIKRIMTKIENDPVASRAYYGDTASGAAIGGSAGGFSVTGRVD
jgi:hypothetical protein